MKADRTLIESLAQQIYDYCNKVCGLGSESRIINEPFDAEGETWEAEAAYSSVGGVVYQTDIVVMEVYTMPDGYKMEKQWTKKDIAKLNETIHNDL